MGLEREVIVFIIGTKWDFASGPGRPPTDPSEVMLSTAYGLMLSRTEELILDPHDIPSLSVQQVSRSVQMEQVQNIRSSFRLISPVSDCCCLMISEVKSYSILFYSILF